MSYPKAMERLVQELEKLPGVGPRTAERLAHHLLRDSGAAAGPLSEALDEARRSVHSCSLCFHLTDEDPCAICRDEERDRGRLLVVEQPRDLVAMEKAGWKGLYHVLPGSLTRPEVPRAGTQTRKNLDALARRVEGGGVREVVMGTNPDLDGDGTAMVVTEFLQRIAPSGVTVTRLARGLPTGGALEYANPAVLAEAIHERRRLSRASTRAAKSSDSACSEGSSS